MAEDTTGLSEQDLIAKLSPDERAYIDSLGPDKRTQALVVKGRALKGILTQEVPHPHTYTARVENILGGMEETPLSDEKRDELFEVLRELKKSLHEKLPESSPSFYSGTLKSGTFLGGQTKADGKIVVSALKNIKTGEILNAQITQSVFPSQTSGRGSRTILSISDSLVVYGEAEPYSDSTGGDSAIAKAFPSNARHFQLKYNTVSLSPMAKEALLSGVHAADLFLDKYQPPISPSPTTPI